MVKGGAALYVAYKTSRYGGLSPIMHCCFCKMESTQLLADHAVNLAALTPYRLQLLMRSRGVNWTRTLPLPPHPLNLRRQPQHLLMLRLSLDHYHQLPPRVLVPHQAV